MCSTSPAPDPSTPGTREQPPPEGRFAGSWGHFGRSGDVRDRTVRGGVPEGTLTGRDESDLCNHVDVRLQSLYVNFSYFSDTVPVIQKNTSGWGRPPNIPPNTKPTPTHQSKQTTLICTDSESLCGWRPCRGHVQQICCVPPWRFLQNFLQPAYRPAGHCRACN